MIFKGFRTKSQHNFVNKLLRSRKVSTHSDKMKTIGVLFNADDFSEYSNFLKALKSLGIPENAVQMFAFTTNKKSLDDAVVSFFTKKAINWKGKINLDELNNFVNSEFDLLVSYYKHSNEELNLVSAASKADLKVGLSGIDDRLYDLIIDVDTKDLNLFKNELKKYLITFNKL